MVTMSAIWDRSTEVMRGRGGMLAGIAAALLFVPSVVQNAVAAYAGPSPGARGLAGLVGLAVFVVSLWGNLSLVAAASDPAVDGAGAIRMGGHRVALALGLTLLLLLAVAVLVLPPFAVLASQTGVLAALAAGAPPRLAVAPAPGTVVGVLAYFMVLAALGLWLTARLALFAPVLVNERRGFGSFARSFELTRGLAWRIVGVVLLFGILLVVAAGAAQAVVGIAARLLLGAGGLPTAAFLAAVATALVTAAGTVVSATFVAQLYRVTSGREAAQAFR